jgi:hypothetical protein
MTEYRITFGSQYRHEPHPSAQWAHPDGWLAVITDDPQLVRPLTLSVVGQAFSSDYAPDDPWYPTEEHYPLGCLARIRLEILE